MLEREALVEQLLEHTCYMDDDERGARKHAEQVADDVLRAREAHARVCALDTMLGLDDMLRVL